MKMIIGKSEKEIERLMWRGKKCVQVMESWVPKDIVKNKVSIEIAFKLPCMGE